MKRPVVVIAGLAAVLAAVLRRRRAQSDTEQLWREATADASR